MEVLPSTSISTCKRDAPGKSSNLVLALAKANFPAIGSVDLEQRPCRPLVNHMLVEQDLSTV